MQNAAYDGPILSGRGVVVIAVQQHLIHHGANLVSGSLNQPQPQILGREFHAIVVLRNLAAWREHHDRCRMRELAGFVDVLVLKSRRFGQRINRFLRASQKVPAPFCPRPSVSFQKLGFLFCRSSRPGEQAFRPHHETQARAEFARSGAVRCRHFSTPAAERWLEEKECPGSFSGRRLTQLHRGSAKSRKSSCQIIVANPNSPFVCARKGTASKVAENFHSVRFWEGHDFSRADKRLSVVIPSGLEAREESAFPTFSAASLAANRFLQICAVEIAPFPTLTEQSHSFFRCFSLVSDRSAACLATFTGDGGTVPICGRVGRPRCASNCIARSIGMRTTPFCWSTQP